MQISFNTLSFGMMLSQNAKWYLDNARLVAKRYDKEYDTKQNTKELDKNLRTIKKFRPKDTLDININTNDYRMIDVYYTHKGTHKKERNDKYEALSNGRIIYTGYFPDIFQFIRYFAYDISKKK